jgi:hypothetical protein
MKRIILFLLLLSVVTFSQTQFHSINKEIASGNFTIAGRMIDSVIAFGDVPPLEVYDLQFQKDLLSRIKRDFRRSEREIVDYLKKYYPDLNDSMLRKWEKEKSLEMRVIDGERKYFANSGPNLFRINKAEKKVKEKVDGIAENKLEEFLKMHIPAVANEANQQNIHVVHPVKMNVKYNLTVDADAVPSGEVIRCWLPFPREGHERQRDIKFIKANTPEYVIADNNNIQRTVYLEKTAVAGEPTVFEMEFEYTACAYFNKLNFDDQLTITINDRLKKYIVERPPHIVFTDNIKELSAKIIGKERNPLKKAKLIFEWIDKNIPWASALEYSTIPNISSYCYENMHGDCGIQSLLFMTLCRYNGIPAKWQSGWMMHPSGINLHDWCEIYFDKYGWLPVDQSFGMKDFVKDELKYFYLGSTDSYRLIVNDDYSAPLFPYKIYPRSETVDFQRGEVEWKGGNLYFDKWDYNMKVTYLTEDEMEK